jgi:predicted DNA-binding WGR domain protein
MAEADYIAELIRNLLSKKNGLSIGVVAFSMEQQGEIESAVQRLCSEDKEFEKVMEEEYKRIEDNQFVGIFFKNLENVQGDERDIIIMSTCYGYDPKGKMIMNFGPINRRGGEKRLNVIFSRAKKHMCVVSSIKYSDIKNEYNEGANYFRKYLQYSEHASRGDMEMASMVLQSVISDDRKSDNNSYHSAVIDQLSEALKEKGFFTKTLIGQSHFKCHLGIKHQAEDTSYAAGILIDDMLHYASNDLLEQYLFKPDLLRYSGWKVVQVFAKDWYEDPQKVVKKIINVVKGIEEPSPEKEFHVEEVHAVSSEPVMEEILPETKEEPVRESKPGVIRLVSTENNSNKFWEAYVEDVNLVINYGKVNTKGQKIIKPFETKAKAEQEMEKLVRQKLNKGYRRE